MQPGEADPELRRGRRYLVTYIGVMGPQDGVDIAVRVADIVVAGNDYAPGERAAKIAAQLAVVRPAHQGRILARHAGLVAVAVERPGLHLALVELAAVQQLMERMQIVIARRPDVAQRRLQFLGTVQRDALADR